MVPIRSKAVKGVLAAPILWVAAVGGTPPLIAATTPVPFQAGLIVESGPMLQLAQVVDYVAFRTLDYSVRVFNDGDGIRMNVFDRAFDILRLDAAPAVFTIEGGNSVYVSTGSYSGNTATYKTSVSPTNEVTVIIEIGAGQDLQRIAQTASPSAVSLNLPAEQQPSGLKETRLAFETSTYSVRVFRRENALFMNVYDRFSGASELNGVAANLVAEPQPPYECAVSYTGSGERNGIPARYFARIDGSGGTLLEIFNVNNQRVFQEAGLGPVTINIPQGDLPECLDDINETADNPYVAAVFGNQETLAMVQELYPRARIERTRQGSYINVGEFANRDLALARVLELRGRGFNARVIFRDVRIR